MISRRKLLLTGAAIVATGTSVPALAADDWNWGLELTLSGPMSAWGKSALFSVNYAVDAINKAGGIKGRNVKVTVYDDAFDPAVAVTRMQTELSNHTINLGPLWAGMVTAVMAVAKREDAFVFVPNNNRSNMQRYKGNLFNLFTDFDKALLDTTGGWFKRQPNIKKLAIIYNPMDEFWVMFSQIMGKVAKAHGVEALPPIELGQGTSAAAAITKAVNQGADGFTLIALDNEMADMLLELERRGNKKKDNVLLYFFADNPSFTQQAKNLTNGAYLWEVVNRLSTKPRWVEFSKAYAAANDGNTPGIADIVFFDAVFLAAKAIADLDLTGAPDVRKDEWKKLKDYFKDVKAFDGITATYDIVDYQAVTSSFLEKFDENGQLSLVEEFK